jgi:hypothetical protein
MTFDAWKAEDGRERVWGTGETEAGWLEGNPPYEVKAVRQFCRAAGRAVVPVVGVLPVYTSRAEEQTERLITQSGGEEWCRVLPGGMRFIPEGFWTGREGRGGGMGCGTRSAIRLVGWRTDPSGQARQEMRQILLAMTKRNTYPAMGRGWEAEDRGLLQYFPLGEAALPHETLSRSQEAAREEEEE